MIDFVGKKILHYKIVEKLGEGGMGVVYLAEDIKLKRQVAIKFLPHHITKNSDEGKRFEIEAQAAAALNHPNIATIHNIEEADDELFIVMEYVKGKNLKDHIGLKPIAVKEAIDIATQIARGLEEAHNKGIVHRDIKSANIMINEKGGVKIMDFGLAKVGAGVQLTKEQSTLGTAAYMSPEQAKGDDVDQKSDIWSFGIVLYEMLTGTLPFKGDYEQAVVYSILNEEPLTIKKFNPTASNQLIQIVNKSIEKDLSKRYQDVSEILKNLNAVSENILIPKTKSANILKTKKKAMITVFAFFFLILIFYLLNLIFPAQNEVNDFTGKITDQQLTRVAILPFSNLKSDPETDYLGYALANQIIGALVYVDNITVRPSAAIRKFEKTVIDISSVGQDLKVDYILTGNYLKQDELVRLNTELVTVKTNELLWRESFEVKYENAFTLQDIVSEKVVKGLKLKFIPKENKTLAEDIPENPLAYEYYLRALAFPISNEGNQLSINMLKKSIELDSTFAPSYAELGFRIQQIALYVPGEAQQRELAERAYLKALSLNSKLISALGNLASFYTEVGKIEKSVELAKRSLAINPNNADSHFYLGYAYRYAGFLQEAKEQMEMALLLDPDNDRYRTIGVTYLYLGEYEKALQGFELDKGSAYSTAFQGQVYLRMNQMDKALESFNRVLEIDNEREFSSWVGKMKAFIEGDIDKGLSLLQSTEISSYTDGEQWYNNANLYSLLGDEKGCIRLLKKAVDGGFFCYTFMEKDAFLDPVRNNPDFQKILLQTKIKHLAFKEKFF